MESSRDAAEPWSVRDAPVLTSARRAVRALLPRNTRFVLTSGCWTLRSCLNSTSAAEDGCGTDASSLAPAS